MTAYPKRETRNLYIFFENILAIIFYYFDLLAVETKFSQLIC